MLDAVGIGRRPSKRLTKQSTEGGGLAHGKSASQAASMGGEGRPGALSGGIPWRAQMVSAALICTDFAAVCAAFLAAEYVYAAPIFDTVRLRLLPISMDMPVLGLVMGGVLVLLFGALGLYRCGVSILNVEEDVALLKGFVCHALIVLSTSFALQGDFSRIAVALAIALTVLGVMLGRRGVRSISGWLLSVGVGCQPAMIYGAGDTGRQLAHRLLSNPQFGLRPVGFVDDRLHAQHGQRNKEIRFGPGRRESLPILGEGKGFLEILRAQGVATLLLAMPRMRPERVVDIQERCKEASVACYRVPICHGGHLRRFTLTFVGDIPLVSERAPSMGAIQKAGKRLFDAVGSALLLVAFAPIFAFVAIVIKASSRGPVIFRQERVGHLGRSFVMYKFRSMHMDAPAYAQKPQHKRDPRVFAMGSILRKTSLDELPQLWNVLKGDMSLVGPRPEMPQIAAAYDALQRERLLVRPGMTGLWQVSGDRNLPIIEGLDYDLYYIYHQSFLLDLAILVRTAFAMFGGR